MGLRGKDHRQACLVMDRLFGITDDDVPGVLTDILWRFNADECRLVTPLLLLRHGRSRDDPIRLEYGGWTARQVTPKRARGLYRQLERRASVDFRWQWLAQLQLKVMWAHS